MTKPDQTGETPTTAPDGAAPRSEGTGPAPKPSPWRTVGLVTLAAVAGAAVGAIALYGMKEGSGNAPEPEAKTAAAPADPGCADAVTLAQRLKPFAKGELAALRLADAPRRLPPLSFTDETGKALTLADTAGRLRLVNLWATWCVPCRKEMPAINALAGTLGGDAFQVVAINLDSRDPDKPRAFLNEIKAEHIALYTDPGTKSFQALRAAGRGFGLPTTLLVDAKGCEIGFLAGPAEWNSADAHALLTAALGTKAP